MRRYFWLFESEVALSDKVGRSLLNAVDQRYSQYLYTGLQSDRFKAWEAIAACCEWLEKQGGNRAGN
jgi:hypothetical protein